MLSPVVREGMLLGLHHEILGLDGDSLVAGRLRPKVRGMVLHGPTDDFRSCTQKAALMGKWCSRSGSPATILALWGLRP